MQKYLSDSAEKTKIIAAKLAQENKNHIFALTGELGAGKTTFVQGFAKGLGIEEKVISPTFVLIRQHKIPQSKKTLFHADLYRLDDTTNLQNLGLQEIWSNPNNIILIEWAEKIKGILPNNTTWVSFETKNSNIRKIIIS